MKNWSLVHKIGYWVFVTPLVLLGLIYGCFIVAGLVAGLLFGFGTNL